MRPGWSDHQVYSCCLPSIQHVLLDCQLFRVESPCFFVRLSGYVPETNLLDRRYWRLACFFQLTTLVRQSVQSEKLTCDAANVLEVCRYEVFHDKARSQELVGRLLYRSSNWRMGCQAALMDHSDHRLSRLCPVLHDLWDDCRIKLPGLRVPDNSSKQGQVSS
jgi:hypothetical protein